MVSLVEGSLVLFCVLGLRVPRKGCLYFVGLRTGYDRRDIITRPGTPETVVGIGDAALDWKTWTGAVSKFALEF